MCGKEDALHLFLSGLERHGHTPDPISIGRIQCYSILSLGAIVSLGGHGKTQFAIQCQHLIDRCDDVASLFCVGAAGSLSTDIHFGDVVVGECTVEHDYKIRFQPAEIPRHPANPQLLEDFRMAADNSLPSRIHFGPISSGDEDIVDERRARELRHFTGSLCVAWEGSGGARAAAFNGIPYLEVRAVTDGADADAAASYRANCERVLPNVAQLFMRWHNLARARGDQ